MLLKYVSIQSNQQVLEQRKEVAVQVIAYLCGWVSTFFVAR